MVNFLRYHSHFWVFFCFTFIYFYFNFVNASSSDDDNDDDDEVETFQTPNLPIVFSPEQNCYKQLDENIYTCKHKVFQQFENKNSLQNSSYSQATASKYFECMNVCLRSKYCEAFTGVYDEEGHFHCDLMNQNGKITSWNTGGKNIFGIICCRLKEEKNPKSNLIMFYNTTDVCRKTYEKKIKYCTNMTKIWHVEENFVKLIVQRFNMPLIDAQTCLNACLDQDDCAFVTIHWSEQICYFHTADDEKNYPMEQAAGWSTYTLLCCDVLKIAAIPIVNDLKSECLPNSNETCRLRAWAAVNNRRMKSGITSKDYLDINQCFDLCLNYASCIGIMRHKRKKMCWIYGSGREEEENSDFISYYLSCCEPIPQNLA